MLSQKLNLNSNPKHNGNGVTTNENDHQHEPLAIATTNGTCSTTSKHFPVPFWKRFYDLECCLNEELHYLRCESKITHLYNPIEYASRIHCAYLQKYLTSPKTVLFIGMNPGPNGMGQTGIPFGNIKTVRNLMKLEGTVDQPLCVHVKRPIRGLDCTLEEPSGVRLWNVLRDIAGDLDIFFQQCFVHNFCPLVFYDSLGRNITPSELRGEAKKDVRDICLKFLARELELVQPKIIVAVGNYVFDAVRELFKRGFYQHSHTKLLLLPHPSPRALNNQNWPEKALTFLEDNNLIKFIRNETD